MQNILMVVFGFGKEGICYPPAKLLDMYFVSVNLTDTCTVIWLCKSGHGKPRARQ